MTWVRATGSAPITAASSALGLRPAPGLATRGVLGLAVLAAGAFLAAAFFAAGAFAAFAGLRGGNLDGANSKFTLSASLSQASMALKGRRVRMETNLSSRSVLPVS